MEPGFCSNFYCILTPKKVDCLIYDKIRWNQDHYKRSLVEPIVAGLNNRGISHHTIKYGHHDHKTYREKLRTSHFMLFLCEHETQGMAYQEAMACNLPILAWDNGFWLDPNRKTYTKEGVPASSVPFFSPECGERFRESGDFLEVLDRFLERLNAYAPRRYVQQALSLHESAATYLKYYLSLAEATKR